MISVIIPAHNEENFIGKLLERLDNQDLSKNVYEVIVVDNASTDGTVLEVWNFLKEHPSLNLHLLHEHTLGVSRAKNTGGNYAHYDNLVFLDADNSVDANFLSAILELASNDDILAATIKTTPDEFNLSSWLFFILLEAIKRLKFKPFGKSFIKKHVFFSIGEFNNSIFLGENVDLLLRAKIFAKNQQKVFSHLKKSPIKCSLRRFHKVGFMRIAIPWFIAYMGITTLSYKTITEISN